MSLSRLLILRGPGISPAATGQSVRSNSTFPHGVPTDSRFTPRTSYSGDVIIRPSLSPRESNPWSSPNPFVVLGTPTTPRATMSYQSLFDDGPLTSPVLDSPTDRNPRALRRHGAVALLAPQTPSALGLDMLATVAALGRTEAIRVKTEEDEVIISNSMSSFSSLRFRHDNNPHSLVGHGLQVPQPPSPGPGVVITGTSTVFRLSGKRETPILGLC